MKEGTNLTVVASEYGYIPEGATLTVTRDHTNQFTGKRTLSVEWGDSVEVPNRSAQQSCQLHKMPSENEWTEVHVGLDREHEVVKLQETEVIA